MSRRRFWANLVVQVSGLLAMLVVAASPALAQAQSAPPPGVSIFPLRLLLTEDSVSGDYQVWLSSQPTGMVAVTVAVSGEDAGLELQGTPLVFDQVNWNTVQTVTVTARRDGRYSAAGRLVTLSHMVRGEDYADTLAENVVVTILNNDDTEPKPTEIRLGLVDLGGVDLDAVVESVGNIDLMVTTEWEGEIALDQDTVVTFRILQDSRAIDFPELFAAVDNPDGLLAAVSPGDFFVNVREFSVTIPEGMLSAPGAPLRLMIINDIVPEGSKLLVVAGTAEGFTVIPTALQIDDNDPTSVIIEPINGAVLEGETFSYTVSLERRPSGGEVQVMVEVTGGRDFVENISDVDGKVLTFPYMNYGQGRPTAPQTVEVRTKDNSNFGDPQQEVTLRHTVVTAVDRAYHDLPVDTVVLTITDNDRAGIRISPARFFDVSEGDSAGITYYVQLLSRPPAGVRVDVSISISEGDANLIDELDPLILSFTADNWDTLYPVTVTPMDDDYSASDQRVTITHTVSGDDSEYLAQAREQPQAEIEVGLLIREDDGIPTEIILTLNPSSGSEGSVSLELEITASWKDDAVPGTDTEVLLRFNHEDDINSLGLGADEVAGGKEYSLSRALMEQWNLLIIDAGASEGVEGPFQLEINDDDIDENDEYIVFGGTTDIDGVTVSPTLFLILDDDDSGVRFSFLGRTLRPEDARALVLEEGETVLYSVVLESEPTDKVTVMVGVDGDEGYDEEITIRANAEEDRPLGSGEDLIEGGALIFTSENWNHTQTVTVGVAENNYYRGTLGVLLIHSVEGGDGMYDNLPVPSIDLVITENDDPPTGIQLSLQPTEVGEGSGTVFVTVEAALVGGTLGAETTVLLRTNHRDDIVGVPTLALQGQGGFDYMDEGEIALVIPRSRVHMGVEFPLTVLQDRIDEDDETIVFGGTVTGYSPELDITLEIMTARLKITDDDDQGFLFFPPTGVLFVPESGSQFYTLTLASKPTGTVNVTLTVLKGPEPFPMITKQLTFSVDGDDDRWDRPHRVSITPVDNNNKNPDVSVTIRHTATGGGYTGEPEDYILTIADDESPPENVSVEVTSGRDVNEDGSPQSVELTVRLDGDPFAVQTPVNLSIAPAASSAIFEIDFSSARITSGVIPGSFEDLVGGLVTVAIPAETSTIKVVLLLTPVPDDIDEGKFETIEIIASVAGLSSTEKATIRIIDNDAAGISLSKTELQVAEGGDAVAYTVELDTEPLGNVVVFLSVDGPSNGIIFLEVVDLTFTPENWDSPRMRIVEVSAGEDDARNDIRELTITHTAVSDVDNNDGYYDPRIQNLSLELIERSVLISKLSDTVAEGESTEYGVRLTSEPTSPVTVEVRILNEHRDEIDDLQLVVDGVEQTIRRPTLTFNRDDWKAYQTVTIQTTNNLYSGTNPLVVIEHTVSSKGDYAGVTAEDFTLDITDDEFGDAATSVLLRLDPPDVDENDGDGFAIVRLTATLDGPTRNEMTTMTLRINDSNNIPSEISMEDLAMEDVDFILASPASSTFALTIPAFNQSAIIDLFFNLVNDGLDEGDSEILVISGEAGTLEVDPVILNINDDDFRGVTVSPMILTVAEGADPVTYTVELTSEPVGDEQVVVQLNVIYTPIDGIIPDDPDEVLLNGKSDLTLVFGGASGNPWNEGQDVGVTLTANDTIDGARDATIEHSVSGADYNGVTVEDVPMALTDYGVLVSEVVLAVDEGGRSTYTLSLTSAPTDDVTVEIVIPAPYDGVLSAEPTTYTFDAVTWSDGVDVTVTLEDDDFFNEKRVLTIEHRVTASEDPNYEELEVAGVEVTLTDDEEQPGLLLELSRDSSEEGSGDDNTIVDVVATVSLEGALRSEVTRGTLRFGGAPDDTANGGEDYVYQAGILFDIPAEEESVEFSFELGLIGDQIDEDDEFFTITASDDLSNSVSARFTIEDDDEAGVGVTLMDQSVREGDEIGYTVVLESQPIEDVRVDVAVERVSEDSEARPGDVTVAVEGPLTLTFNSSDWSIPRDILLTVESDLTFFGELEIRHTAVGDPTYAALPPVSAVLELTDVDVDLGALEVMTAAGETTDLLDSAGEKIEFSADVAEYFAAVPFPDRNASITATPSAMEEIIDEQEKGRVRIFRKNGDGTLEALESGADVAGTATEVNLPEGDTFAFLIEVSARPLPLAADEEIARQTYTLTLRRALPASAELQVYLADDDGRDTPITALDFGPDENEMDLILILRDDDNIRYSISEISHSDLVPGLEFLNEGSESGTGAADFETPVTLSRAEEEVDEDVPYSLSFTATPKRPLADANPLSVTIGGTLKANTATRTEIQATYLGEHQDEKEPILPDAEIRVSDNGTVTIELRVVRSGGGDRPFNQSDFSISIVTDPVDVATAVLMEDGAGYTIEIAPRTDLLSLTVEAEGGNSLGDKIGDPLALAFTVSFESPQAVIRAVANPDPLFAFSDPFFAFVGEDGRLPLEVVLADGSTPLANSVDILGELALALLLDVEEGEIPKTVTIAAGDSALPGRDLTFAIDAPKNSVTVEVAVDDGAGSDYVEVDNLVFTAHFLSLEHDEEIDFRQDPDPRISKLSLKGENEDDDSWSFRVANEVELADDEYKVEEVTPDEPEKRISTIITKTVPSDGSTITYTVRMDTVQIVDEVESEPTIGETSPLDEADALSMYEEFADFAADAERTTITILVDTIEETYRPFVSGIDAEARLLRVTRLHPDAEDSRILLEFEYFLDGRYTGVFTRAINLINGVPSNLKVEVTPSVLVVAKGGAPGQVQLVISNLDLEDDPSAPEASIVFRVDPDLVVERPGRGEIDRINSRFEQTLSVTAAAAADREKYTVVVEVLLPGKRLVRTEFTVDINDAPQYVGEKELTVYESGDNNVAEHLLEIVDSDGGLQFLNADELSLQVIGFDDAGFKVGEGVHTNDYFALAFSEIGRVGQEGPANGKRNALTWTLTLTGKLATPFNSVVQLLLYGVTDGFDDFEQYLTVQVKNRPPQLELAMTQAIAVFLEQEPVPIEVTISDDVTDVVVLDAPDDLVVKYDEAAGVITLRRLNIDPANDAEDERAGSDVDVKLAALDAQGGRKVVTITVARPPLLPQIAPPNPLLIAAGQGGTRLLELVKGTALDVAWTVVDDPSFIEAYEIEPDADGHRAELSLTVAVSAEAGQEFELLVTAGVAADEGGYQRTARLPVVVVAAAAKPHLKLSATVPDSADPTKPAIVSSFALTEALSIGVALEGEVPSMEDLGNVATLSFQIRVAKLGSDSMPLDDPLPLIFMAESRVEDGATALDIEPVPAGELTTILDLKVGDVVEVSIGHLRNGEVSDEIIVGDSLRLRVSEGPGRRDADNDGLADSSEGGDGPAVLGPITAAVAKVTDSGVESQGDDIEVSLSLGDVARFLGLGECGGVSLTLTLSEDGGASLSGCPDGAAIELSQLLDTPTLMALELEENGEYQLIDLSATFDSSEADPGEPLVISLPVDPQQPHVVYRFDEEGNRWVPVLGAGLPGQPDLGGQGALDDLERDCESCFYALDFDRDGSVQLLLLLVPIDPVLGLEFALDEDDASLEGRRIEISAEKTTTITLLGFEGLIVEITGDAIDGGNVDSSVSDDGTVELIGLKRTRNSSAEEVLIEAFDPASGSAVASITLYVTVPNQPPKITFEHKEREELRLQLPSGEFTTALILDPTEGEGVLALAANTETVLLVMIRDADDDISFDLELMDDGRGVAKLESNFRGLVDGEPRILHELTLSSMGIRAGKFEVRVGVTDLSDESKSVATLFGCVLNSEGQCPAAPRSGGGGGGGTGLLWLLFAAPAALCRLTRLRQRLAARARRASP